MSSRIGPLVAVLVLATASSSSAQNPAPIPSALPLYFESWRADPPFLPAVNLNAGRFARPSRDRTRHALVGGAIGAVAGLAICTAISTLINDSAHGGLSACPGDTYLLMGSAGFVLGFAIGWAV